MVSQFRGKAAEYIKTGSHTQLIIPGREKEFTQKVINGWRAFEMAHQRDLVPTPYFFEALHYVEKAKKLQKASLDWKRTPKVGDPLMEAIPIYNTVQRRYAGFSNVPEFLWYGCNAPKVDRAPIGIKVPVPSWRQAVQAKPTLAIDWTLICLLHRLTGSGASFESDHGWRNNHIVEASQQRTATHMGSWLARRPGPIFTSIGNQIPPFNKPTGDWSSGGRQYIDSTAYQMAVRVHDMLLASAAINGQPMGIKPAIDAALKIQGQLGHRQFKFVFTAWIMDVAEYLPHLVDPNSDCYHGKNAIEAMNICFDRLPSMKLQTFYDTATRLFADATGTHPMDVEDASPGCDLVRWIENYVPKKGFDHVREQGIFNGSSLVWHAGRQP